MIEKSLESARRKNSARGGGKKDEKISLVNKLISPDKAKANIIM